MRKLVVDRDELDLLFEREENHTFDRKSSDVDGRKIQKVCVAFANADGGQVVIGIKDEKEKSDPEERWDGLPSQEDFNSHLQAIFNIQPGLSTNVEFLECEGFSGVVLRVYVERGSEVHKTNDGKVYQRWGAQSLPLLHEKIQELSFAKGASSFEDQLVRDMPPELVAESDEIKEFIKGYSPATDALEYCVNENLLDFKDWTPRVASAVLFHPSPPSVIPRRCGIKITRYETREDDPEREHLADQVSVELPAYQAINEVARQIKLFMEAVTIWTDEGLAAMEYPPEAIWETLVNAIIHRDYSISDDIHIHIYDNRIEMISPGKFPGYVNESNYLDARFSRNSKIIRNLSRYKKPPNKDMGEGLDTTFQKMKEWGLKDPIITEEGNYVRVVLPHIPLAKPSELILNFLTKNSEINNKNAREMTGIKSENAVKKEFYKLRDEGLLEKVPGRGGAKSAWRLTNLGRQEAVRFESV